MMSSSLSCKESHAVEILGFYLFINFFASAFAAGGEKL